MIVMSNDGSAFVFWIAPSYIRHTQKEGYDPLVLWSTCDVLPLICKASMSYFFGYTSNHDGFGMWKAFHKEGSGDRLAVWVGESFTFSFP